MNPILTFSLLSLLVLGTPAQSMPLLAQDSLSASPNAPADPHRSEPANADNADNASTTHARYDSYISYSNGLRFVYPEGYRVDSSTAYTPAEPPLEQSLEIWKEADYTPALYQGEWEGSEWPPHITLQVFLNPDHTPLSAWKRDLVVGEEQVVTVAGQAAIAYQTTGLYEADNLLFSSPDGERIIHISVSYMDADDPARQVMRDIAQSIVVETLSPDGIPAKTAIDYRRLQTLLAAQNWQAADVETRSILMRLLGSDYFYPHLAEAKDPFAQVACEDLRIIDALWSKASEGRFGFRAQQQIWQGLLGSNGQPTAATITEFGQSVGWWDATGVAQGAPWRSDADLTYTASAAPGAFPWAGVSSMTTDRMLINSGPSCGSCTVDAFYILSDRYSDYLLALFAKLSDCGCG